MERSLRYGPESVPRITATRYWPCSRKLKRASRSGFLVPLDPSIASARDERSAPKTKGGIMAVSARNQLKGEITDIVLGTVMAHITIQVGENLIESVITRRSAD